MINIFRLNEGVLEHLKLSEKEELPGDAIWVDLIAPSKKTRRRVEKAYHISLPDERKLLEIEATSRFFVDEDGMHIHSMFLHDFEETPVNATVAFILKDGCLFTLRREKLTAFHLFKMATRRQPDSIKQGISILLGLFEHKVDHLADALETTYTGLNRVSNVVLGKTENGMEEQLEVIAKHEDQTGKVRLSLLDAQRALSFIQRNSRLDGETSQQSHDLLRDIDSLLPHTAFLFDKVNFLMDAVQGFINIEQNKVIKILSIAAVVFLPPTLIASIYGMNFRYIPELHWDLGYPYALFLMIVSGIAPYRYFKYRGWL